MDSFNYNELTQIAKIKAGLKGGPYFNNPVKYPAMKIVDGYPESVNQKLGHIPAPSMNITDPWYGRRNK